MGSFSGVADVKNTLRGTSSEDVIIGGNLADRLYGNAAADNITGGAGNDYIDGGSGLDSIDGGAGNDTLVGGNDPDAYTVEAGEGNDTIIDRSGAADYINANLLLTATSGVFIKRGNDLILAEGTVNLTGDADGDGDDNENLATELAGIQLLASAVARRAGMRSIVSNLTSSVTIKNHFSSGEVETITSAGGWVEDQTLSTNLVDYNTGLNYFNQAVTNPNIVRGTGAADVITASDNDQILKGGKGDDIYYIDAKTNVIIEDTGGPDQIIFDDNNGGAGGTYVYTKEGNNLKITFDDGSGAVVASAIIKNFYLREGAQIEKVGCDIDGDIHTGVAFDASATRDICDKVAALTSATKVLRGTFTDDRLDLAATGQTAYGGTGNDEYTVTAGKAVIYDTGSTYVHSSIPGDTLNADHLATEADGVYIKRGNDLIILDGGDDPDGAGGFGDADAAITAILGGGASYDTAGERRAVLNTLIKMSDSITVKNFFTSGQMEIINALNNTEISLNEEILPNLIDYSTGLLASAKGAGDARVNGTGVADYILASVDGQKLYGGAGDDIYAIPGGLTDVEIYDTKGDLDVVKFTQADLNGADSYELEQVGNDLKISVTDAGDGDSSVLLKNYYLNNNNKINRLEDFDAGVKVDLAYGTTSYLYGSTGDDTITAEEGKANKVYGQAGDDILYGATTTNDSLYGGEGNDTLLGGFTSNDYLYGEEGSDVYEILSGEGTLDFITEVDATSDDTDKVVFKGADFSGNDNTIQITAVGGGTGVIKVEEGNGLYSGFISLGQLGAGTNKIEVLEDAYGNSINLSTGATSGTFNAAIEYIGIRFGADSYTATDAATNIDGGTGADNFTGGAGNDTITGGDGGDTLDGQGGDDLIDGGLGDDAITPGAGNDVLLYDLDAGTAGGADTVTGFTIGEDVVRFTTSANDTLGLDYRNHIAVRDTGAGLEIGYGWDEATQDYTNTITFDAYNDASALTDNVIEFVTSDGTTALTAAEVTAILADIAADGDAPGTLAAVHDDIDAGAGGADGQLLVDSINAAW